MISNAERWSLSEPIYICSTEGKHLRVLRVVGQLNPFCSRRDPRGSPAGMVSPELAEQGSKSLGWPRVIEGPLVVRSNSKLLFLGTSTFLCDLQMPRRQQEPADRTYRCWDFVPSFQPLCTPVSSSVRWE